MRIKKSSISLLFSMLIGLFLISCGGQSEEQVHGHGKAPEKIEVPETYEGNPAIQAYLHLKDQLVLTDAEQTRRQAKLLLVSLSDYKGEPEMAIITENATKIMKSDDISVQREAFKPLSGSFAELASRKDMGIKLYMQYCPMAFDNAGASWLSAEEEIFNPYFGDKMLHCGVVKDEI